MEATRLAELIAAWLREDLDALMPFITEDCVYITTTGPDPGTVYAGKERVRQGFSEVLASDDGPIVEFGEPHVFGDRGLVEWSQKTADGRLLARGCDLFEFRGDRISRKDAFRKVFV